MTKENSSVRMLKDYPVAWVRLHRWIWELLNPIDKFGVYGYLIKARRG